MKVTPASDSDYAGHGIARLTTTPSDGSLSNDPPEDTTWPTGVEELILLLVAASLHQPFAQIHPFADGNGRVTRAPVTWHLVQYVYLPMVVTRHDRNDYIDALEVADYGDLTPLLQFTARLHRKPILQTLSTREPDQSG